MHIAVNDPIWDQPIEILPLIQAFPQFNQIKEFRDKNVVLTKDHERLFSVISQKKKIFEHREAVEMIGDALQSIYGQDPTVEVNSMKSGAQIRAKFELPDKPIINLDGDISTMHVLFYNSYDSGLPFKMRVGAYRQVCSNGAVVGDTIACIKGKDMAGEWSPGGLANLIEDMISKAKKLTDVWEKWTDVSIEYNYARFSLENRLPKKMVDSLLEDTFPKTLWELYNDLTSFATHQSPSPRARVSMDQMISQVFYSPRSQIYNLYTPQEEAA